MASFWAALSLPFFSWADARAFASRACASSGIGYLRWAGSPKSDLGRESRLADVSLAMFDTFRTTVTRGRYLTESRRPCPTVGHRGFREPWPIDHRTRPRRQSADGWLRRGEASGSGRSGRRLRPRSPARQQRWASAAAASVGPTRRAGPIARLTWPIPESHRCRCGRASAARTRERRPSHQRERADRVAWKPPGMAYRSTFGAPRAP